MIKKNCLSVSLLFVGTVSIYSGQSFGVSIANSSGFSCEKSGSTDLGTLKWDLSGNNGTRAYCQDEAPWEFSRPLRVQRLGTMEYGPRVNSDVLKCTDSSYTLISPAIGKVVCRKKVDYQKPTERKLVAEVAAQICPDSSFRIINELDPLFTFKPDQFPSKNLDLCFRTVSAVSAKAGAKVIGNLPDFENYSCSKLGSDYKQISKAGGDECIRSYYAVPKYLYMTPGSSDAEAVYYGLSDVPPTAKTLHCLPDADQSVPGEIAMNLNETDKTAVCVKISQKYVKPYVN